MCKKSPFEFFFSENGWRLNQLPIRRLRGKIIIKPFKVGGREDLLQRLHVNVIGIIFSADLSVSSNYTKKCKKIQNKLSFVRMR